MYQFKTNNNIPTLIHRGTVNQQELDKMLNEAFQRTPPFFKSLLNIEDPTGRGRTPVGINIDSTYIDIEGSGDNDLQKSMYYSPRAGHTAKFMNLTDLSSKIVGLIPIASSQSPSSGDGLLLSKHIELEDASDSAGYMRTLFSGNHQYFVVLVTDIHMLGQKGFFLMIL